jgi:C4-dicarboxylate-specific signal transduction histidine kinase
MYDRVLRRDVRLPGHRTKDEFDINQLLLSERADKVRHKLRKATKRAGSTGAMLSDVNSQLMATSNHQASHALLHHPLALEVRSTRSQKLGRSRAYHFCF